MSASEPEVMSPETSIEPRGKRRRGLSKQEPAPLAQPEPNPLIADAMRVEGLTLAERLQLIDKVEAIYRERQEAAAERAFYAALSAFQRECPVIKKKKAVYNKDRTTIRYYYAPLGDIVKQVGPLLAKHGLSYDFSDAEVVPFEDKAGGPFLKLTTNVHHSAGHSRGFPFLALIEDNDFMNPTQQAGSSNMYAKRYGFCNAFGILTAEDDLDGNAPGMVSPASARTVRQPVSQPQARPSVQKAAAKAEGERVQISPAAEGEVAIESSTLKVLTKKMGDSAEGGISIVDFQKRFPAFQGIEDPLSRVKRSDINAVMNFLMDPVSK